MFNNLIQIAGEENLIDIESYTGQIGRVVLQPFEVFNTVVATHIPSDVVRVSHHNLGDGCCPASASDNCYLSTVVHLFDNLLCLVNPLLYLSY